MPTISYKGKTYTSNAVKYYYRPSKGPGFPPSILITSMEQAEGGAPYGYKEITMEQAQQYAQQKPTLESLDYKIFQTPDGRYLVNQAGTLREITGDVSSLLSEYGITPIKEGDYYYGNLSSGLRSGGDIKAESISQNLKSITPQVEGSGIQGASLENLLAGKLPTEGDYFSNIEGIGTNVSLETVQKAIETDKKIASGELVRMGGTDQAPLYAPAGSAAVLQAQGVPIEEQLKTPSVQAQIQQQGLTPVVPTPPAPTTPTTPTTGLGAPVAGFPQTQAQMAEWQQKYTFDQATGKWYEKAVTPTAPAGTAPLGPETTTEPLPTGVPAPKPGTVATETPNILDVALPEYTAPNINIPTTAGAGIATSQPARDIEIPEITAGQQVTLPTTGATLSDSSAYPGAPDYKGTYEILRSEQGIQAIETRITDLNKLVAETEASLRIGLYDQEGKLMPMELIETRQLELTRKGQEALDSLNRQKAVLIDEYSIKMNLVSNLMQFTQMDYNAAVANYNTSFTQAIQLQNLLMSVEDRANAEANAQRDDARANLGVVMSSMSENNVSWDTLTPEVQTQIQGLELRAGLPSGSTQALYNNLEEDKNMMFYAFSNDKTEVSVTYDDGSVEVFLTGLQAEPPASGTSYQDFSDQEKRKLDEAGIDWTTQEGYQKAIKNLYGEEPAKGTTIQFGDKVIDVTTTEGVKALLDSNFSYEDIYSWLDQNVPNLQAKTIDNLIRGAGGMPTADVKGKENELKVLEQQIGQYMDLWKKEGDAGAGTREKFIADWAQAAKYLTYEEIRDALFTKMNAEWVKANTKKGWLERASDWLSLPY